MNYLSEKRKTQIDFNRLGLDPRLKSGALDKATKGLTGDGYNTDSRANTKQGAVKTRKRSISPEGGRVENSVGLKPLWLPEVVRSGIRAHEYLKTIHGSPWQTYEKSYDIRLGADDVFITVVEREDTQRTLTRKDPFSNLALVKSFVGPSVEGKLRKFQQIQHANIVFPLEVFRLDGTCYVVFEYMAYSLYYVAGNPRLDEIRLAAIVGQILDGLMYLASEGLEHGSLTCSNILIHPYGDVKIASQECCKSRPHGGIELRHLSALSVIVMELMQGYPKEDGAIGVDDVDRWPLDSNAVDFLSMTESVTSMAELTKHPLLCLPWRKGMLTGLVSFVSIDTRVGRRYPPK